MFLLCPNYLSFSFAFFKKIFFICEATLFTLPSPLVYRHFSNLTPTPRSVPYLWFSWYLLVYCFPFCGQSRTPMRIRDTRSLASFTQGCGAIWCELIFKSLWYILETANWSTHLLSLSKNSLSLIIPGTHECIPIGNLWCFYANLWWWCVCCSSVNSHSCKWEKECGQYTITN